MDKFFIVYFAELGQDFYSQHRSKSMANAVKDYLDVCPEPKPSYNEVVAVARKYAPPILRRMSVSRKRQYTR